MYRKIKYNVQKLYSYIYISLIPYFGKYKNVLGSPLRLSLLKLSLDGRHILITLCTRQRSFLRVKQSTLNFLNFKRRESN